VDILFKLGLVVVLALGIYSVCRPRPNFVVRIVGGVPRVVRGKVARGFLQEIGEVCDRHGVEHGEVRGLAAGHRIALAFSGSVPEPCRQQLRNLWNLSGWSAGPGRPQD
jgi:hypothetical protein